MNCKSFEKEFKSNLLYVKFYLDMVKLTQQFASINEGWKVDTTTMIDSKTSYRELDYKYMCGIAGQLLKNDYGTLGSVADYTHSVLTSSEVFNNTNTLISIVPTTEINPERKLIHSSINNVNVENEMLPYHSAERYKEFNKNDERIPLAEPIEIYFGRYIDLSESATLPRAGVSHFNSIENHIYHALYLWCLNVSPLEIDWT